MKRQFKNFDTEIRGINNEERTLTALVSTATRDRSGEVLDPDGADLKNFRKNPVVLFAHNYSQPPIGKAMWIKKTSEGILSKVQFAETALAEDVFNLYKDGYMKAFSVGFVPKKWEDGDGEKEPDRTYKEWELVEYSAVPVPANPDALALALKKNVIKSEAMKKQLDVDFTVEDFTTRDNYIIYKDNLSTNATDNGTSITVTWDGATSGAEAMEIKNSICIEKNNAVKSEKIITLSAEEGINATIGRLEGYDGKDHVGCLLFDKKKWTVEHANEWVEKEKDTYKKMVDAALKTDVLDVVDALEAEIKELTDKYRLAVEENRDLRYRLYQALQIRENKPEITGDGILKAMEDAVAGVIRQVTGKV